MPLPRAGGRRGDGRGYAVADHERHGFHAGAFKHGEPVRCGTPTGGAATVTPTSCPLSAVPARTDQPCVVPLVPTLHTLGAHTVTQTGDDRRRAHSQATRGNRHHVAYGWERTLLGQRAPSVPAPPLPGRRRPPRLHALTPTPPCS